MSHDHHHHGSCCSHDHHSCCSQESDHHCHEGSCDAHHHDSCHEHDHFYSQLIEMADEAWMEVLKCKIKDRIKEKNGSQLDELAKIVSDSNHSRWKHKLEARKGLGDFKNKIQDFFHQG